jgi:hypothetical protein
MPLEDKQTRRLVERELSRHALDTTLLSVAVINAVATFHGRVSPLRGAAGRNIDIKEEMRKVQEACLLIRGVSEVSMNISFDK